MARRGGGFRCGRGALAQSAVCAEARAGPAAHRNPASAIVDAGSSRTRTGRSAWPAPGIVGNARFPPGLRGHLVPPRGRTEPPGPLDHGCGDFLRGITRLIVLDGAWLAPISRGARRSSLVVREWSTDASGAPADTVSTNPGVACGYWDDGGDPGSGDLPGWRAAGRRTGPSSSIRRPRRTGEAC